MSAFLASLDRDQPRIGLWMNLTDPAAIEIVLSSGFDWVLQDTEHAPIEIDTVTRALQIAGGRPTEVIVRPPLPEHRAVTRLLDIGARTLLVPMVDTPGLARELASAMDFPPHGTRGVSSQTRGGNWGRRPDYLGTARDELALIVQIESATGVRNAADIFAVDGVDAAFVGTADLAASMGFPGQPTHPEVEAAVAKVTSAAKEAGLPLGTLTRDLNAASRYADQGFSFIGVGTDSQLFGAALADLRSTADPVRARRP